MKRPFDDSLNTILVNTRNLFYKILFMASNNENPFKYIFSSENRKFYFAILLLFIGTLLLLLSNLMI